MKKSSFQREGGSFEKRKTDFWGTFFKNLKSAAIFGALVFLVSYPNIYYFTNFVFSEQIGQEAWSQFLTLKNFLFSQIISLVFLLFLCAFCGFSFSPRHGLPGLGQWQDLQKNALRIYFPLSLFLMGLSYLVFDSWFMQIAPKFYPRQFLWALAIPFRSAFMEELVFRFGLVTVVVGATKKFLNPLWAVGVVSLFYAVIMIQKTLDLVGLTWQSDFQFGTMAALAFFTNFLLGWIYVKRGLISSIFFHFCLGFKYLIFSVVSG